jgi:xkdN-like protein
MAEINLVQSLLNKDIESLTKKETCTYKVESLSKKLGINFEITLQALNTKDFMRLRRVCSTTDKKGKTILDNDKFMAHVLVKGIINPDLGNKDLLKHYKVATPAELVLEMFTITEVGDIVAEINDLSGVKDEEEAAEIEEEIKN